MSDTLQPPPSAETPEQAQGAAPDQAPTGPVWPAWPTEATEATDQEPARVPILSAPPADQAPPPAEQRLPAPAPQYNYPQPYPQPYPPQRPEPAPYAPQAVAVAEPPPAPPPDLYAPPPPPPQSPFWKAVKWPIRQSIKGIYLLFSAAGRHKVATVIVLGTLLLFTTAGAVLYGALHPDTIDAHIITQSNLPPLPSGVKHWIEGYQTYNGQEVWDSLTPDFQQQASQQGNSAAALQSFLSQAKTQNIVFNNFVYAGGYIADDGTGHYMVEANISQGAQKGVSNWYFITDTSGKIAGFVNTTPQSGGSSSGSSQ